MRIHHLNCGSLKAPFINAETIVYCLLVETSSGPVLIDTGFGTQDYENPSRKTRFFLRWMGVPFDPKELAVNQVQALGFNPKDVLHIIQTHMHIDHAGGLVDFPWADVHIYEVEYQGILKPKKLMEIAYIPDHWRHGPKWIRHQEPVVDWFGFKAIPILNTPEADFLFIPLPGHTRGHCGVAVGKPGNWLLHCGDAASTFYEGADLHNRGEEAYKLKFLPKWLAESIMGGSIEPLRSLLDEHGDEVKAISAHDIYSFREYNNILSTKNGGSMYLSVGQKAPEFELPDENGKIHALKDYVGQYILLYFYPKDDTPGCTTEACNFRDDYSQYDNANVVILGVSPDPSASHLKFKEKYGLPFTLLADEGHQVCELFGVWGPKKSFGREYDGVFRTTYLIDPDGIVKQVFIKVSPANHSAEVLALLK